MALVPDRVSVDRSDNSKYVICRYHFTVTSASDIDDDLLQALYGYWSDLRRGRNAPSVDDIDPIVITSLGLMGLVHIANVESQSPNDYFFQTYGARMSLDGGTDYTGFRISDYNIPLMADLVAFDYFTVKRTALPAYHHVAGMLSGSRRGYKRLILPLTGDRGEVDHLLIGVQFHKVEIPDNL